MADISKVWLKKIAKAQTFKNYLVDGKLHARIPYGQEGYECRYDIPCHDCGVVMGQLHVENCDMEKCPICGGQALGCECLYYAELVE